MPSRSGFHDGLCLISTFQKLNDGMETGRRRGANMMLAFEGGEKKDGYWATLDGLKCGRIGVIARV